MNKKNNFVSVEINVVENNETRKAAFAKGINRDVNLANAKKIMADIKLHGYRKAEVIHVIPAEKVIENRDLTLIDINNNPIPEEYTKDYYLVIDGQHRVFATSMFNEEKDITPIQVPAMIIDLKEGETISEYITAINVTKMEWKPLDYVRGAANVQQGDLLTRYKELIKCEDNPDGFPLSTLNIIFCGNSKAITKTDLSLLCQGKTQKGVKVKKDIIPPHNLSRGNRFIDLCTEKGFKMKDLSPRYLAEQFQNYRNEKNDEEAFRLFESISENDRLAMYLENGKISEAKVIEQFNKIKERMAS